MCLINASNDSGRQAQENESMGTDEAVGFRGLIWLAITGRILFGFGRAVWLPVTIPYIHDLNGGDNRKFALFFCKSI